MKELYTLHAEICQTLANPKRLEILDVLRGGERSVTELVRKLSLSKANISQHLAILRLRGVVNARRQGLSVYYRVANPKIIKACMLMREVLAEQLNDRARLTRQWDRTTRAGR